MNPKLYWGLMLVMVVIIGIEMWWIFTPHMNKNLLRRPDFSMEQSDAR